MSSRRLTSFRRFMARKRRNRPGDDTGWFGADKSLFDAIGATQEDPGQYTRLHAAVMWEVRFDSTGKLREDKVALHDLVTDALVKAGANLSRQASGFMPDNPGLNWARALKDAVRNCKEPPAFSTDVLDSGGPIELDRPAGWTPDKGADKKMAEGPPDNRPRATERGSDRLVLHREGGEHDDRGDGQSKLGATAERQVSERLLGWGHIPGHARHDSAIVGGFTTDDKGLAVEKHAEALREKRDRQAEALAKTHGEGLGSRGPTRKPDSEVSPQALRNRRRRARARAKEAERAAEGMAAWRRANPEAL